MKPSRTGKYLLTGHHFRHSSQIWLRMKPASHILSNLMSPQVELQHIYTPRGSETKTLGSLSFVFTLAIFFINPPLFRGGFLPIVLFFPALFPYSNLVQSDFLSDSSNLVRTDGTHTHTHSHWHHMHAYSLFL